MLATIEIDGERLNADELGANGLMFVIAGQETTRNSLSAGMLELIQNSAEMDRLRADPRLLKSAPDEFVRWGNPVAHLLRTATADIELGGKTIKAVTGWSPGSPPPTATNQSLSTHSASTSGARPIRTSASASGHTSASVHSSRGSRCGY